MRAALSMQCDRSHSRFRPHAQTRPVKDGPVCLSGAVLGSVLAGFEPSGRLAFVSLSAPVSPLGFEGFGGATSEGFFLSEEEGGGLECGLPTVWSLINASC